MMNKRKIDPIEQSTSPNHKRSFSNLRTDTIDKSPYKKPLRHRGSLSIFQSSKDLKQKMILLDVPYANPQGKQKKLSVKKCKHLGKVDIFQKEFEDFINKERGKEKLLKKIKGGYDNCIKDLLQRKNELETAKKKLEESKKREAKLLEFLRFLTSKGININALYSEMLSKRKVPLLVFSDTNQDFQEEFMSNYDEFSESWKRQLDKNTQDM